MTLAVLSFRAGVELPSNHPGFTIQSALVQTHRDDVAFDVHRSGPSVVRFREEIAGMGVKVQVTRCALVD
jgi:hypothetical protein